MKYQFFYEDYVEEKSVPSNQPLETTLEKFAHSIQCVLHRDGNFIGLVNERNETLQFYYNEDQSISVDIPIAERSGSYSQETTLDECVRIVRALSDQPFEEQVEGLTFNRFDGEPEQQALITTGSPRRTSLKPWWKFW